MPWFELASLADSHYIQAYLFMASARPTDMEKRHVLILLAASFERIEDYGYSLRYYKIAQKFYPQDKGIKKKIKILEETLKETPTMN